MDELVIDFADSGTQVFHVGEGSVAVPGLLAGLEEAHGRFATRAWAELVEPALALAHDGASSATSRARSCTGSSRGSCCGRGRPARSTAIPARVHTEDAVRRRSSASATPGPRRSRSSCPSTRTTSRLPGRRAAPLELAVLGLACAPTPSQGGGVVRRILELLAEAGEPLARRRGPRGRRCVRPARLRPAAGHDAHLGHRRRRAWPRRCPRRSARAPASSAAGTQLNNMLGELDVIGTGREGARRAPREHDDPDARARRRTSAARAR